MKISEEEKQKRWVIGVSGGADSMALLNKCIQLHIDVVVAHMNYQKRASAQRDMEGVQAFCARHQIPCVVVMQEKECKGNFQAFARNERYAMYYDVMQRYHGDGVMIAHQLDDHLETYIMQKQRAMTPSFFGIKRSTDIHGCPLLRPLLDESKAQLEAYCIEQSVPYFLDESNLSDDYTRNRIRHTYIDKMNENQKQELAKEIKQANILLTNLHTKADLVLKTWTQDVKTLRQLPSDVAGMVLRKWIFSISHIHISQKECDTIYKLLHSEAYHWTRYIDPTYDIGMQYDQLSIQKKDVKEYRFQYENIQTGQTPYFSLALTGRVIEGITLAKSDFPITIRNFQAGDCIQLRLGQKKINRFFIDRKIPKEKRALWPIVVNAHEKIIFVPEIGCDISHFSNNPNLFVIK